MTLEHGKTHCEQGLITDRIAHGVKDADADLWSKQPSGAETIEMLASLTSESGISSAVIDACSYFLVSIANLTKKSGHKLLSIWKAVVDVPYLQRVVECSQ